MKEASNKKYCSIKVGTFVKRPISSVDKSKGDPRNLIRIVMEVSADELYKIGTRRGIIRSLYYRNRLSPCEENFLNLTEIPQKWVRVWHINGDESPFGLQGFVKCNCTKKCKTMTCKCQKIIWCTIQSASFSNPFSNK